jgi:hypothetical protein
MTSTIGVQEVRDAAETHRLLVGDAKKRVGLVPASEEPTRE